MFICHGASTSHELETRSVTHSAMWAVDGYRDGLRGWRDPACVGYTAANFPLHRVQLVRNPQHIVASPAAIEMVMLHEKPSETLRD